MNKHFTKKDILVPIKCMKECSISLLIRDINIKPHQDVPAHPPECLK